MRKSRIILLSSLLVAACAQAPTGQYRIAEGSQRIVCFGGEPAGAFEGCTVLSPSR